MNPDGNIVLLQLKHIGNGHFINKPFCRVNDDFFKSHSCVEIKEGYLLINRLVSSTMSCCIMPELLYKAITAVDVCWIAPDDRYNLKYLMYYMMSREFQLKVLNSSSGSTRKRISKRNLIKIEFFIHDRQTQNLIVKEIEALYAIIDKLVS